jgi:hypothetical protein
MPSSSFKGSRIFPIGILLISIIELDNGVKEDQVNPDTHANRLLVGIPIYFFLTLLYKIEADRPQDPRHEQQPRMLLWNSRKWAARCWHIRLCEAKSFPEVNLYFLLFQQIL